jgi:hypothetical protein
MSDSHVNWWMDAGCRWHRGQPPPDWWQAGDGRWHPPAPDDTTAEIAISPPVGGAHLAGGGGRTNLWDTYRGWPRWARLAAPIAAFVLAIGVLGAAATEGLREDDPETAAMDEATPESDTTTTAPKVATPAPTATTTVATTTTDSMASTTAQPQPDPGPTTVPAPAPPPTPAPTNNGIHPGAPCSPEGATALSGEGMPMTCTTQKCHGAPYSEPRWRRTAC